MDENMLSARVKSKQYIVKHNYKAHDYMTQDQIDIRSLWTHEFNLTML
jgi:hypothetical protein